MLGPCSKLAILCATGVKDGQLSSNLSEKLMALADTGITTHDELCKRALKGLPRRHAA